MQLLDVACLSSELICVQVSAYGQTRIALLLLHGRVISDTRKHPVNAVAATLGWNIPPETTVFCMVVEYLNLQSESEQ